MDKLLVLCRRKKCVGTGWPLAKFVKSFGVVQCVPKLLTGFAAQASRIGEALAGYIEDFKPRSVHQSFAILTSVGSTLAHGLVEQNILSGA
jgi:hypothetical protein